jgi:hypothetical protein
VSQRIDRVCSLHGALEQVLSDRLFVFIPDGAVSRGVVVGQLTEGSERDEGDVRVGVAWKEKGEKALWGRRRWVETMLAKQRLARVGELARVRRRRDRPRIKGSC